MADCTDGKDEKGCPGIYNVKYRFQALHIYSLHLKTLNLYEINLLRTADHTSANNTSRYGTTTDNTPECWYVSDLHLNLSFFRQKS